MPDRFFVPLDVAPPVSQAHLHGAITRWFDASREHPDARATSHWLNAKPYSISPLVQIGEAFGVQISTLTDEARGLLFEASRRAIRLGGRVVRGGSPRPLASTTWAELADEPARSAWRIELLTPTLFRSGGRPNLTVGPPQILRAPTEAWQTWGAMPPPVLERGQMSSIRVVSLEVTTHRLEFEKEKLPALVGTVSLECDDPGAAAVVSKLLALASFSGIGSYRQKGCGVVEVTPLARSGARRKAS